MKLDVAIVGGGPVGLAAAIEAKRQGLTYQVLEKGCIANSIFEYPTYMTFFTTSELLEIGGHPFVSSRDKPDRKEALDYYRLVTAREGLNLRQYTEVTSIGQVDGGFALEVEAKTGEQETLLAANVIVATGYYTNPVWLGVPGEDLENVSHYYTEPHPFWNLDVTVIGGGNSACEAALDLHRHGARVTLVHRGPGTRETVKYWVKPDIENRLKEGAIKGLFNTFLQEIRQGSIVVIGPDGEKEIPTDFTFVLTGYVPDTSLAEGLGVRVDVDGCVPHDEHTFETRDVKGLYVIGSAAFGQYTNRVFIENGREHAVRAVRCIAEKKANATA
ncbi:MAG TPA: YpdA family putative bacillithiol disulfide reductase [Deinococcales bacterium]|nr:YpdA family putative bacillithiol disulfide reductase [Deinococcales bacterium]